MEIFFLAVTRRMIHDPNLLEHSKEEIERVEGEVVSRHLIYCSLSKS